MDTGPDPALLIGIEIIAIIAAVLISALLSAAEQAITNVNKTQIREKAEEGDKRAGRLVGIFDNPHQFVASGRVFETFSGLFSCVLIVRLFRFRMAEAFFAESPYIYAVAVTVLVMCVACVFLVLAVIYPRQIALHHPEGVSLALSGFALFFSKIGIPFAAVAHAITFVLLKVTKQHDFIRSEPFSEQEVMSMLETGQETGAIKEEGLAMIDSIFAFDDKLAYEVMTPRTDVFSIDLQDDYEDYADELMEMRYSRIPVQDGESDNVVGILNIKDYIIRASEDGFENVNIAEIMRKPFFVPDTKNIDSLFFELQKTKQHIAVLIDEYGGFSGIVTMEDLIEEIVGDIDDEYDEEEPEIEKVSDTVFYLDGSLDLDDINEETGAELESENNETVGGLIIDLLGEIPEDGDDTYEVGYDRYKFTVESVKDHRIERVKMEILPEKPDEEREEDDR